ncbi:MAG TPA: hypothetical protein DHW82_03025 [Spirochaetia bacterium]|nr:MAG: hypothetical protein A2Y41_03655 [Spirochaetes bacterium GWB1_36_13]HCL55964.1 hypothetical protein [Spirochaetia bacterium]
MNTEFGLSDPVKKKLLSVLEKHPAIKRALIYGSRAKGNYREGSDIDMALFGENLETGELMTILNEIDDLLLPYTLDLSIYHHLKNDRLKEHIDRAGKVFYEKKTERV